MLLDKATCLISLTLASIHVTIASITTETPADAPPSEPPVTWISRTAQLFNSITTYPRRLTGFGSTAPPVVSKGEEQSENDSFVLVKRKEHEPKEDDGQSEVEGDKSKEEGVSTDHEQDGTIDQQDGGEMSGKVEEQDEENGPNEIQGRNEADVQEEEEEVYEQDGEEDVQEGHWSPEWDEPFEIPEPVPPFTRLFSQVVEQTPENQKVHYPKRRTTKPRAALVPVAPRHPEVLVGCLDENVEPSSPRRLLHFNDTAEEGAVNPVKEEEIWHRVGSEASFEPKDLDPPATISEYAHSNPYAPLQIKTTGKKSRLGGKKQRLAKGSCSLTSATVQRRSNGNLPPPVNNMAKNWTKDGQVIPVHANSVGIAGPKRISKTIKHYPRKPWRLTCYQNVLALGIVIHLAPLIAHLNAIELTMTIVLCLALLIRGDLFPK